MGEPTQTRKQCQRDNLYLQNERKGLPGNKTVSTTTSPHPSCTQKATPLTDAYAVPKKRKNHRLPVHVFQAMTFQCQGSTQTAKLVPTTKSGIDPSANRDTPLLRPPMLCLSQVSISKNNAVFLFVRTLLYINYNLFLQYLCTGNYSWLRVLELSDQCQLEQHTSKQHDRASI